MKNKVVKKNTLYFYRVFVINYYTIKFNQFVKKLHFKPRFLDLLKWVFIDIYRLVRYKPSPHLYGVRCLTGMYGCGKTMAMTKIALDYRNRYGNKIYISTNYGLGIQDFPFDDIKQISIKFDKPIIFFWDEVQNEFPSSDRVFSREVLQALTLNRKGHGQMYFWASQDHELVHKSFRRLTIEYGLCRTFFKRYTRVKWYQALDFECMQDKTDTDKRFKIHPFRKDKFIQTDYIRSLYNSFSYDNGEKLSIKK